MDDAFERLAGLDRLIHEPARLALLSALTACESADFQFLQRLTALTGGNLSSHLSKLEENKLIALEKQYVNRRPNTRVRITDRGREAIERHWQQLEELRQNAQQWTPDNETPG